MVQGASSSFPPRREQGLEGTRSLLSSRLQREHEGADPIPARPPACLWLGHRESSFYCGRLRPITRKRPPVAGGAPLLCFPIPFARDSAMRSRVWISDRRRGHATPLVVAHGARRVWRHPANSIVTMLDRRTLVTNVSAKNRPHRQPEVPSIESPGVNARPTGKGFGPSCERPRAPNRLELGARLPGMPFRPRRPFARRGENGPEARWGEGVRPSPDRSIPVTRLQRCEACGFEIGRAHV